MWERRDEGVRQQAIGGSESETGKRETERENDRERLSISRAESGGIKVLPGRRIAHEALGKGDRSITNDKRSALGVGGRRDRGGRCTGRHKY